MSRISILVLLFIAVSTPTAHTAALNDPSEPSGASNRDLLEATTSSEADLSDYALPDERLGLSLIDSSPDDSYLAVKCDSQNQLFVGGRRKLFVLKPNSDGTWKPRELVYEFPEHTWVYDIEFRGDDVFVSTVSAIYRLPTRISVFTRWLGGQMGNCFSLLAIRLGTTVTSRAPITGRTGRLFMAQKKNGKSTTVLVRRCASIQMVRNLRDIHAD